VSEGHVLMVYKAFRLWKLKSKDCAQVRPDDTSFEKPDDTMLGKPDDKRLSKPVDEHPINDSILRDRLFLCDHIGNILAASHVDPEPATVSRG
jgi:hypothetical protein